MKEQNINASRFFQDNLIKLKNELDEKKIKRRETDEQISSMENKIRLFIEFIEQTTTRSEEFSIWFQERKKQETEKMPLENIDVTDELKDLNKNLKQLRTQE